MARRVKGSIPFVEMAGLTPASENDLAVFKPVADQLAGQAVFADRAYADKPLNERLMELQDTFIYTPVKLIKGQSEWERNFVKAADGLWSTAVSRIRQPIESLFNRTGTPVAERKNQIAGRFKGQSHQRTNCPCFRRSGHGFVQTVFLTRYSHFVLFCFD
ncbi:transposase [Persicitalea sp.]|uniref:transposase n=1 Tax=Persicitalea sp. TaxID=3100273 RepID=UPI003594713D